MLTKLNNAFLEWDGFDMWQKLTLGTSIICFAVPAIWATWVYWVEMSSQMPENANFFVSTMMLLTLALVYVIALGFLAWVWVYVSIAIGVAVGAIALPFIWLYRKICP